VPPVVYDLRISALAREKLGRRGISVDEALQFLWNEPRIRPNHRAPFGTDRYHLLGHTNGGRRLMLVIEATADPTTWEVVTGWQPAGRRLR
jgi:uncharacterized DUF497 family protein